MNTTLIVILTILTIVVLKAICVSAWKRGCQAGIEYATKYSISRTIDEMRKVFEQMGYGAIFDKVVDNTFNIEKLQQYTED